MSIWVLFEDCIKCKKMFNGNTNKRQHEEACGIRKPQKKGVVDKGKGDLYDVTILHNIFL